MYSPETIEYNKCISVIYDKCKALIRLMFTMLYVILTVWFASLALTNNIYIQLDIVHYGVWDSNFHLGKLILIALYTGIMFILNFIEVAYLEYIESMHASVEVMLKYGNVTGLVKKDNGTNI